MTRMNHIIGNLQKKHLYVIQGISCFIDARKSVLLEPMVRDVNTHVSARMEGTAVTLMGLVPANTVGR